jgi:hypothetical protein
MPDQPMTVAKLRELAQGLGINQERKAMDWAADEIERLRGLLDQATAAVNDCVRRPLGVVPDSAVEFYRKDNG